MTKKLMFTAIMYGVLTTATSSVALECGTAPTCEELGYSDNVVLCPDKYVACPFDKTKGVCMLEATVGQVAYFPKTPNLGWVRCNGQIYRTDYYPELAALLGSSFCNSNHGGTCSEGYFRVPKYDGYFLRVAGTPSSTYGGSGNSSIENPQAEQLPNIEGALKIYYTKPTGSFSLPGILALRDVTTYSGVSYYQDTLNFNASTSSAIYQDDGHVIPANYAAIAYIYAGRYGEATGFKTCEFGDAYDMTYKKCFVDSSYYSAHYYLRDNEIVVISGSSTNISSLSSLQSYYEQSLDYNGGTMLASDDVVGNTSLLTAIYKFHGSVMVLTSDAIISISNPASVTEYSVTDTGFSRAAAFTKNVGVVFKTDI